MGGRCGCSCCCGRGRRSAHWLQHAVTPALAHSLCALPAPSSRSAVVPLPSAGRPPPTRRPDGTALLAPHAHARVTAPISRRSPCHVPAQRLSKSGRGLVRLRPPVPRPAPLPRPHAHAGRRPRPSHHLPPVSQHQPQREPPLRPPVPGDPRGLARRPRLPPQDVLGALALPALQGRPLEPSGARELFGIKRSENPDQNQKYVTHSLKK